MSPRAGDVRFRTGSGVDVQTRVEQAVARGEEPPGIAARLGLSLERVQSVVARMDAVATAAETGVRGPDRGRRKGST